MPDERKNLNNTNDLFAFNNVITPGENDILSPDDIFSTDLIKSLDNTLLNVSGISSDDFFVPDTVKSLDDALIKADSSIKDGIFVPDALRGIDDAIRSINGVSSTDFFVPDKIKNLDDALLAVDNSGLMPAPVTDSITVSKLSNYQPAKSITTGVVSRPLPPDVKILASERTKIRPEKEPEVTMPNFNEPDEDTGPPDFKINFDFDSAYRDPPEDRPLRRRRERRTGLVGGVMFAIFILCSGLVAAGIMWLATVDVLGFDGTGETVNIMVPVNFTMEDVTDILYEAGLIRYKALFNLYSGYSGAEDKISPGSYVLSKNYDYRALVQGMTARAGVRVETTVVIPEGYTLAQIFKLLEDSNVCSEEDLWDSAAHHDFNFYFLSKETLGNKNRLEGFLFPDTYNFYENSSAVQALTKMLRQFDSKYTEMYVERADTLGYTVREIVTIASMIEREAGSDEERPRIAAVIYNRLNNPAVYPMLEIDATIHYYRQSLGVSFAAAMMMDNEYNTYMYPGLPPGPIANPGLSSIQAALYPLNTNEYFYALNKEGTHNFFRNASDHSNFVNSDQYGG